MPLQLKKVKVHNQALNLSARLKPAIKRGFVGEESAVLLKELFNKTLHRYNEIEPVSCHLCTLFIFTHLNQ